MFEGSLEFELPTYGCWKKARDWGGKMREAHVEVKMVKPPQARRAFGTRAAGNARGCGRKHISKPKCEKHNRFGPLLDSFGRSNFSKRMQAWDVWRGSAKMHFAWQAPCKRHLDQTCQEVRALICWERLHSWSIRSSGLLRCVTGAALRMTWSHFFVAGAISTYIYIYLYIYICLFERWRENSQNSLVRSHQLCAQLLIWIIWRVSQACCPIPNLWGNLVKFLRFGAVNFHYWSKSPTIVSSQINK